MAAEPFDYALEDIDLIKETVDALRKVADTTVRHQQAIHNLQLLETVLRGVRKPSLANAKDDTRSMVHCCGHFCRPPLEKFLRRIRELESDMDRMSDGIDPASNWTTKLVKEVLILQRSIGNGLRVIDILLWVEELQNDSIDYESLPRELQQAVESLQQRMHSSKSGHFGRGHYYHNIQTGGSGNNHYGDVIYSNPSPVAPLENMSRRLDEMATTRQVDQLISLVKSLKIMPSSEDGVLILSATATTTVQSFNQQSVPASLIQSTKLWAQHFLETIRTQLMALLALLLWTIPAFRTFAWTLATFARMPTMLLDSNINFVGTLGGEVSLPYQQLRTLPNMLAHLQSAFKDTPGETYVVNGMFDLFYEDRKSQLATKIPLGQWEEFVSPGMRIVMSILLGAELFSPETCPFCKHSWKGIRRTGQWAECIRCRKPVLDLPIDQSWHVIAHEKPSRKHGPQTASDVNNSIQLFNRVHGRSKPTTSPAVDAAIGEDRSTATPFTTVALQQLGEEEEDLRSDASGDVYGYSSFNRRILDWREGVQPLKLWKPDPWVKRYTQLDFAVVEYSWPIFRS